MSGVCFKISSGIPVPLSLRSTTSCQRSSALVSANKFRTSSSTTSTFFPAKSGGAAAG